MNLIMKLVVSTFLVAAAALPSTSAQVRNKRVLEIKLPSNVSIMPSRDYDAYMCRALEYVHSAAWSNGSSSDIAHAKRYNVGEPFIAERSAHEFSLAASGAGASIILVAAAGTWDYLTIKACTLCITPVPATMVACSACIVGAIGVAIQFGLAYASGEGGDASVSVGARSISWPVQANATHSVSYLGPGTWGHSYHLDFNGTNAVVVHADEGAVTLDNMHEYTTGWLVEQNKRAQRKRDTYDISWFGVTFDNFNTELDYWANNAYETNPDFFNTIIAAGIVQQPTTKYCLSMGLGDNDAALQNAFHGEIYTNAYGGIDAFCNDNSDNWWAQGCQVECNDWQYGESQTQGNCWFL